LLLGLVIWTGTADGLVGAHDGLAFLLVLSLWTLAAVAAASRVSILLVVGAVGWSLAAIVLGGVQKDLLTGGRHWTVQVAHLVVGLGVIGWGILLAARIREHAERMTSVSRVSEARPDHLDIKATLSQREAAARFLAVRRVAVTGVSRTAAAHGANVVYQRLRERGYEVFAVNPNAERVEGDHAYPNLRSIPAAVEAVVIGTRPDVALDTVKECVDLGITRVWMHRLYGTGSVAADATRYGRDHGVMVIDGGCPLMFDPTADIGHKLLRRVATVTGNAPRRIETTTASRTRTRDQTSIADACDPLSSAPDNGDEGHAQRTGP
jgi:predicted CoA-binding protein